MKGLSHARALRILRLVPVKDRWQAAKLLAAVAGFTGDEQTVRAVQLVDHAALVDRVVKDA